MLDSFDKVMVAAQIKGFFFFFFKSINLVSTPLRKYLEKTNKIKIP